MGRADRRAEPKVGTLARTLVDHFATIGGRSAHPAGGVPRRGECPPSVARPQGDSRIATRGGTRATPSAAHGTRGARAPHPRRRAAAYVTHDTPRYSTLSDAMGLLGTLSLSLSLPLPRHGARNLDTVPATIDALPRVTRQVAGRVPVLVDGGIRRGTDIVKALALGAQAVLIGRPYVFGLAVGGAAGVTRVIDILRNELELAMKLCGVRSVATIDQSALWL